MLYQTGDEKILQDSSLLTAGFFKPSTHKLSVYPNPVKDVLYTGVDLQDASVQISDNLGRVVLEKTFEKYNGMDKMLRLMTINVNDINPGIYSVIIITKSSGKIYQSKFIKE
jgi:hypothetical protein